MSGKQAKRNRQLVTIERQALRIKKLQTAGQTLETKYAALQHDYKQQGHMLTRCMSAYVILENELAGYAKACSWIWWAIRRWTAWRSK